MIQHISTSLQKSQIGAAIAMAQPQGFRNQLNNRCQEQHKPRPVYEDTTSGPQNNITWSTIVYIDGVEHGRGTGRSRDIAREAAAQIALQHI
ncbi:hypothetical protein BDQ12DRAFT_373423 [Crucibulum laeve]|uniref:DRBM domain-containing protein n=1 Tax=Crucibulum laeve TaxID=68775 RepID=A0A5C3LMY1_9AGAR|nr:hypothetical protein BDQ12DRAFT_373423 [Crucibulum laeve]